jgi:hypothetical protein
MMRFDLLVWLVWLVVPLALAVYLSSFVPDHVWNARGQGGTIRNVRSGADRKSVRRSTWWRRRGRCHLSAYSGHPVFGIFRPVSGGGFRRNSAIAFSA